MMTTKLTKTQIDEMEALNGPLAHGDVLNLMKTTGATYPEAVRALRCAQYDAAVNGGQVAASKHAVELARLVAAKDKLAAAHAAAERAAIRAQAKADKLADQLNDAIVAVQKAKGLY